MIVDQHGVKIVAPSNLPATMAADSSALYARNLLNFLDLLFDAKTGELRLDRSDEIIAATLVCTDGAPVEEHDVARSRRRSDRHQPDRLRAGDLRRLPRGLDRDAGAAHAADGGDQRHLRDRHRRRHAGRRADGNSTAAADLGVLAVALAAVNVFGGFLVTQRMLEMFKKKEPDAGRRTAAECTEARP